MLCEKELIKKLEKGELIGFNVELNGQYDSSSNNGLLHIPSETLEKNINAYILIKIDEIDNAKLKPSIYIQIISLYKYNANEHQVIYDFIPINQFITGLKNSTKKNTSFYIMPRGNTEDKLVLEFSTNNPYIMLVFNGIKELDEKENIEKKNGIIKYIINSSNIPEETEFTICNTFIKIIIY